MTALTHQYRVEQLFREVLSLTAPECVEIRQIDEGFIICMPHLATGRLYILATARNPDEPRAFADIGRAINFAHSLSGLLKFQVELKSGYSDASESS